MLSNIKRKSSGIAGTIVVVLLALIICLGGVSYYGKGVAANDRAALVNGDPVSQLAVERIYSRNKYALSQAQPDTPLSQADLRSLRQDVVEQLIRATLRQQFATKHSMQVPDSIRNAYVMTQPAFQVDQAFSPAAYLTEIQQVYGSEANYLARVSEDMVNKQIQVGLADSVFMLPYELTSLTTLLNAQRDVAYIRLDAKQLTVPKATDEEIKRYYQAHESAFQLPEQARVRYIVVDKQQIAESLKPSEAQLRSYYQDHQSSFVQPVAFRYHTYLLHTRDEQVALSDAEEEALEGPVKQAASKDSALKSYLRDHEVLGVEVIHAAGWTDSRQVEEPIRDRLQALHKSGVISIPQNDGYMVIELVGVRGGERDFAAVKKAVRSAWVNSEAERQFVTIQESLAELAYTADDLEGITETLPLPIHTSSRFSLEKGAGGITDVSAVRAATFGEEVYHEGRNSNVIKLSDNAIGVVHLEQAIPAEQIPLAKARNQIQPILQAEAQEKKAASLAKHLVDKLAAGQSVSALLKAQGLS